MFDVSLPAGAPPLAGYWDLANYGSVTFNNASASTTFAGVLYDPSEGQPITMTDSGGNPMSIGSVAYRQVVCTFVSDV